MAADIRQRGIRRREFERFITELEKLPETVSEFDEALWGSLVEYVTVGNGCSLGVHAILNTGCPWGCSWVFMGVHGEQVIMASQLRHLEISPA